MLSRYSGPIVRYSLGIQRRCALVQPSSYYLELAMLFDPFLERTLH
jgi:hypothetical protein